MLKNDGEKLLNPANHSLFRTCSQSLFISGYQEASAQQKTAQDQEQPNRCISIKKYIQRGFPDDNIYLSRQMTARRVIMIHSIIKRIDEMGQEYGHTADSFEPV